jgi:hypothetical protein
MIDTVESARFDNWPRSWSGVGVCMHICVDWFSRGILFPDGHYIAMSPCSAAPRGSSARSGSILSAVTWLTRCLLYFAPVFTIHKPKKQKNNLTLKSVHHRTVKTRTLHQFHRLAIFRGVVYEGRPYFVPSDAFVMTGKYVLCSFLYLN